MAPPGKRILIVTGQKPIAQVKTSSGGDSTLYEVYATDEHGETIEEPLRTFAELEEGVPIEYEINVYNHHQYGTTYTLVPPKRNSFKRLRVVEEEMKRLIAWATEKGYEPSDDWFKMHGDKEPAEEQQEPTVEPAMEPVPAPERPDLDERFGKDAPWTDDDLDLEPPK